MARLFISNKRLDSWSDEGRVAVDGDRMTLVEDGRSFAIDPAVRFLKVVGGDEDPHELVGKVKRESELDSMGAEHYVTSVIMGETAYDVQQGFLGDPLPKGSDGKG